MKKVALLIILFSFSLHSQTEKAKSFFGVKGGTNFLITKKNAYNPTTTVAFGYQLGGSFEMPLSNKISFKPELLLQSVTSKYSHVDYYSKAEFTDRDLYLHLPLNFNYYFVKKVSVEFGPNVSLVLNSKSTINSSYLISGGYSNFSGTQDNTSKRDRTRFGWNLGINYNLSDKTSLGFRYLLFLKERQLYDNTLNNSVFSLSFGYNFK